MSKKTFNICLVASAGGHLAQLRKLSLAWRGHQAWWITTTQVVHDTLRQEGRVYVVGECNRRRPLQVVPVLLRCMRAVSRERPNVVISTGAAAGCLTCFLAKLLGAKVVWVDSITNVKGISLSGRMVRPIADLFLVQWPELAQKYEGTEFVGAVI